jgi:nucleoside-diphosphate-sugar epimerase
MEAEVGLMEISKKKKMSVVIIRPPLVYGQDAPGNFGSLIRIVKKQIPLPLGAIKNKRSFVFLDNLVDMIICCLSHPNAVNQVFLVSDDEDLSTPDLINYIASAMGRSARLFPFPVPLLKFLGFCIGRSNQINRLIGSLQLDIEQTRKTLNWSPQVSAQEGIRRMVQGK